MVAHYILCPLLVESEYRKPWIHRVRPYLELLKPQYKSVPSHWAYWEGNDLYWGVISFSQKLITLPLHCPHTYFYITSIQGEENRNREKNGIECIRIKRKN